MEGEASGSMGRRVRPKRQHTGPQNELALLPYNAPTPIATAMAMTTMAAKMPMVNKNQVPSVALIRDGLCKFIVLLPYREQVVLEVEDDEEMRNEELARLAKREALKTLSPCDFKKIRWGPHCSLEDTQGRPIPEGKLFDAEFPRTVLLQDGSPNPTYSLSDMWDVTPEPEMLERLPLDYSLETALADILDNSLQAVWENRQNEKRLISVTVNEEKITIFDTGSGMDSTLKNSIAKWGTMGASSHRFMRSAAIGGEPPFLKPFFGMYGYGGLVATMHLGGVAVVSSKTKASKKVVTLTLEREVLVKTCKSNRIWKTPGEFRDFSAEEVAKSPHGSFTKVEISKLKPHRWNENQIKCMLKDIYFPYIQCDYSGKHRKIITPVEFEVNGTSLIEVDGGEVVVTNLASCNGAQFVLNLHFKRIQQEAGKADRANARITCLYFPIVQGTESIDSILETLREQGMDRNEDFEHFCRVSVRHLGRLLPDARWGRLPFMQPKRKRTQNIEFPQECYKRVKAFIDTDAGFTPLPSKTDLSSKDIFTIALRSLGSRVNGEQIQDASVEILRERRILLPQQLDKEFCDWIKMMHEKFDEDIHTDSESVTIVNAVTAKELGLSQEVFRVHYKIRRHGCVWHSNTRVKILKGIPGAYHKDMFATLEFFVSEGFEDDSGETKIVYRSIDIPKQHGSRLEFRDENPNFKLERSKVLPVDILSGGKCEPVNDDVWKKKEDKINQNSPGFIEILDIHKAKILGVEMGFPPRGKIEAGTKPPCLIMAVVRPKKYISVRKEGIVIDAVDRKSIINEPIEMTLEVLYRSPSGSSFVNLDIAVMTNPTIRNTISGIYCFSTEGNQLQNVFSRAGDYRFTFSLKGDLVHPEMVEVSVGPSETIGYWRFCNHRGDCNSVHPGSNINLGQVRLGGTVGPLYFSCYDKFGNMKILNKTPTMRFEIWSKTYSRNGDIDISIVLPQQTKDGLNIIVNEVTFIGGSCQALRPNFEALLKVCISKSFYAEMEMILLPGEIFAVKTQKSQILDNCFKPGDIIRELILKVEDAYGNCVEMGKCIKFHLDGIQFQDSELQHRKVDENGCVNLGGLLKIIGPFNSQARILVLSEDNKELYRQEFSLLRRRLHVRSEIPEECPTGSLLDIIVEFLDENGVVDIAMNGFHNILVLEINRKRTIHTIEEGVCCIESFPLPDSPGIYSLKLMHLAHPELLSETQIAVFSTMLALPDIRNYECAYTQTQTWEQELEQERVQERVQEQGHEQTPSSPHIETERYRILRELETIKEQEKKCRSDLLKYAKRIEQMDMEIKSLTNKRRETEDYMSQIEDDTQILEQKSRNVAEILPTFNLPMSDSSEGDRTNADVLSQIQALHHPVSLFLEPQCLEEEDSILGAVALLGSLESDLLSCILSEFIGKKNMLSLVCKTEKNQEDFGILGMSERQGRNLEKRLRLYILSKMRLYEAEENGCVNENGGGSQKLLSIPHPMLRDGTCPTGFLGYAVNAIILNEKQLNVKIPGTGYISLRESLFYALFKKLQIYDTVKNLHTARHLLDFGGVSLDGGLIRDGGCIEIGSREQSRIVRFPVKRMHGSSMLRIVNEKEQRLEISNAAQRKKKEKEAVQLLMKQIDNKIHELEEKREFCQRTTNRHQSEMEKIAERMQNLEQFPESEHLSE